MSSFVVCASIMRSTASAYNHACCSHRLYWKCAAMEEYLDRGVCVSGVGDRPNLLHFMETFFRQLDEAYDTGDGEPLPLPVSETSGREERDYFLSFLFFTDKE